MVQINFWMIPPCVRIVVTSNWQQRIATRPAADAPIDIVPPSQEDAGPLEIGASEAIRLALENRLDLRAAKGGVHDAQREVVIAADALGAELTFLGAAAAGESRSIASATRDDASLRFDRGIYDALLTFDLPIERTKERNDYTKSWVELESAIRKVKQIEDQIKIAIQDTLRTLVVSRESLKIQAKSFILAKKRVKSTNLFLKAGKAQIRDFLESQEALFTAQNNLTSAVISYRLAELELQREMGILKINADGLWQEYTPGETSHEKK